MLSGKIKKSFEMQQEQNKERNIGGIITKEGVGAGVDIYPHLSGSVHSLRM